MVWAQRTFEVGWMPSRKVWSSGLAQMEVGMVPVKGEVPVRARWGGSRGVCRWSGCWWQGPGCWWIQGGMLHAACIMRDKGVRVTQRMKV